MWCKICKTQQETQLLLGKYTDKSYQCDEFPLILPLLLAKYIFYTVYYAIYYTFSENNKFSSSFRGKHVNKYSAVSTLLEINLKHLHALHSNTTRCPCLPSDSKLICYKELTLTCPQSACLNTMCGVWG